MSVYFIKHLYSEIMQCTFCTCRKLIPLLEKSVIRQEEQGSHADRYKELRVLWYLFTTPLHARFIIFTVPLTFSMQILSLSGIYICTESMRNDFPSLRGTWLFLLEAFLFFEFLPCIINLEQSKNVIFNLS